MHSLLPVLWIFGAPGAGKSVTAWLLADVLGSEGLRVAYVDVDQLGMLYPDDDDGYRLKTDALNVLIPNYAEAGAQVLVVSGVLDPRSPVDLAAQFPRAKVTFCLLNPDPATLRRRILERGWSDDDADEVVAEAAALTTVAFGHVEIDSATHSVADVVRQVLPLTETLPRAADGPLWPNQSDGIGRVVALTGPRAVGTSTVGFGLARSAWDLGLPTGFMDLDQLSFLRTPAAVSRVGHGLGVANGVALGGLFTSRGATTLIVSSHLADTADIARLRSAVTSVTVIRLRADDATLAAHVLARTREDVARLAGDDLINADTRHRERIVRDAIAQQRAMDQHADEDLLIDVSNRTADSVVDEIRHRLRFIARCGPS